MARLARIVVPGMPHHVTARGNQRKPIFFEDGDQAIYRDMLAEQLARERGGVWAYCLMPNHVHLILCPEAPEVMGRALGAAHRRWANFINGRGRWRGHFFDGRYASSAMAEAHLIQAVRYVALVERPRPQGRADGFVGPVTTGQCDREATVRILA